MEPRRASAELQRRAAGALAAAGRRAVSSILARYLAGVLVLLATVLLLAPTPRDVPTPAAWDYQHEQLQLDGGGLLNAYARSAIQVTAFTARTAIERQRDLHRFGLLEVTAGEPAARVIAAARERARLPLEVTTVLGLLALIAYGAFRDPQRRIWLAAIGLLLTGTLLVTHPQTVLRAAAAPGHAVQTLSVKTLTLIDPTRSAPAAPSVAEAQQEIASRYWAAFVGGPLSRMQTGTPLLADAPADTKPGVLDFLRSRISAVNRWAVGERGPERAVIATFALAYALPFALGAWALSMLATAAQALLLLLVLAALAAVPLAAEPRWRAQLKRLWLVPLAGAAGLLAATTLLSLGTLRLATVIHGGDEYLGMLLAGAILPAAALTLITRRLARRWHAWRTPKPKPPEQHPQQPQQPQQPAAGHGHGHPDALGGVA